MSYTLSPPKSEREFEELCCELLKEHWKRPGLIVYGRNGQSQGGIDIVDTDASKPIRCVQCKLRRPGSDLDAKKLEGDLEKVRASGRDLDELWFLTTASRSTKIIDFVLRANAGTFGNLGFSVRFMFWEEISELLSRYPDALMAVPSGRDQIRAAVQVIATKPGLIMSLGLGSLALPAGLGVEGEVNEIVALVKQGKREMAWHLITRCELSYGNRLTDRDRCRLITAKADILIARGEGLQGGNLLVQARALQPSDEKAAVNEVVGLDLLKSQEEARTLAKQLLHQYPGNLELLTALVRLNIGRPVTDLELRNCLPEAARDYNLSVALGMYHLAWGDEGSADQFLKSAVGLEPDQPQVYLLLGQQRHRAAMRAGLRKDRQAAADEAVTHLSRAVELAHQQGLAHLEGHAHLALANLRDYQDDPAAADSYREACRLLPSDADARRRFAVFLSGRQQHSEAIEQADGAVELGGDDESKMILATVLWDSAIPANQERTLALCQEVLKDPSSPSIDDAVDLLTGGRLATGMGEAARRELEDLPETPSNRVVRAAALSRLATAAGNQVEARRWAEHGLASLDFEQMRGGQRELAVALLQAGMPDEALPIARRLMRTNRYDPHSRLFLACAARAGRDDLLLETFKTLREAGEGGGRLLHEELDLLQTYDRQSAIEVLCEHLETVPTDRLARLRLTDLAQRSERRELAVADPAMLPPPEADTPPAVAALVLQVLHRANRLAEALDFAYHYLRRRFDEPAAHEFFYQSFLHAEAQGFTLLPPRVAKVGTAVEIEWHKPHRREWVILESDGAQHSLAEVSPTGLLGKQLLGKGNGTEIILRENTVQPQVGRVVSLAHRVTYRAKDVFEHFGRRFPGDPKLQAVYLSEDACGEPDFTPILESVRSKRLHIEGIFQHYREVAFPIHSLAKLIGGSYFGVMGYLASPSGPGVRCAPPGVAQFDAAVQRAIDNPKFVLELSALFSIWRLGLEPVLIRSPSVDLYITQATWDTLRGFVMQEVKSPSRFSMFADQFGQVYFHEKTKEAIQESGDALLCFLQFVRSRCSLVASAELAALPRASFTTTRLTSGQ